MPRHVELEHVTYNIQDIENTAGQFLYKFAAKAGIKGAQTWMRSHMDLAEIIREQRSQTFLLQAFGLSVEFSGFPPPIPKIQRHGIVFSAREPRFTIYETNEQISPLQRTHITLATENIMDEMHNVYHLEKAKDPLTLIFPKKVYAKHIEIFNAALL